MESKVRDLFGDKTITIDNTATREIKGSLVEHPDPITFTVAFWSPWSWRSKVDRDVRDLIDVSRVMVQRMPTQDEVDALVQHSSRHTAQSRIGIPVGMAGWSLWFSSDVHKSGLAAPLEKLWGRREGQDTPGLRAAWKEVVQGVKAQPETARRLAITGLVRFGFLVPIAWSLSEVYARSVQTKGMLGDSRLMELMREMREQGPEVLRNRRMEAAQERYKRKITERPQHQGADTGAVQEQGFSEFNDQDQSPVSMESSVAPPEGVNENKPQAQPDRRFFDTPSVRTDRRDDSRDFFDDASPVAPDYVNEATGQPVQGSGSAWERIRQQNAAPAGNPRARQDSFQQGRAHLEDRNRKFDYGYDKERDREQARAEFDKLVESERNITSEFGSKGGW